MIELSRFFVNNFYPLECSEASFMEGVDSHIAKMQITNPIGYSSLIATSIVLRDSMRAAVSARDTESGQQQGSTITMQDAKDEFTRFMRVSEGLLRYTFQGAHTAPYQEFLPQGLTEIDLATLGRVQHIMDRIVNAATIYQGQLGAPFLADCIAKRQAFLDARGAQVMNKEEHTNLQILAQKAIEQMGVQLCINLYTIALDNIGEPSAVDSYFEPRYFQRPEVSGIYVGTNAADQTKTVRSQGWTNEKNVEIINKGTTAFVIGFANADGVAVGDGPTNQIIPAGETRTFTAQQMGYAPGNAYLNITADDSGAIWEVRVTD